MLPSIQTGEGWSWESVIELDDVCSSDLLSQILVTMECPQLQGQPPDWGTEGGSLGESVLQCSGSHSGAGSA